MLKRQTRSLIVTDPPTREERARMEQHAAAVKAGDAAAVELAAGLTTTQTRITVGTLNTLQYGRYETNRRRVGPWLTERTGQTWEQAIDTAGGLLLLESGLRWARVHAAVTAVETRTANRVTDEATNWQAADWPALSSLDAFTEDVPGDLVEALDRLVFDLNPVLFRFEGQTDADAKKNGGISGG